MIDIIARIDEYMASKIKLYPCYANRASSLGDDCIRRLVYMRAQWENAVPHSIQAQYIFEEGNKQEQIVLDTLRNAGITVIKQQSAFKWDKYNITGSIDGVIVDDDNEFPLEIKSMSPFIWDSIDTTSKESLKQSLNKKPWTRKYLAQMVLYLLLTEKEQGIFIFKNKSNGLLKVACIYLDDNMELGEELIKRAELINEHIKNNTLPDRISDASICEKCQFQHICIPDLKIEGLTFIDNEELEQVLDEYMLLKDNAKRFKELDDFIKETVKGKMLSIGKYMITGNWIDIKEKTVITPSRKDWRKKIELI